MGKDAPLPKTGRLAKMDWACARKHKRAATFAGVLSPHGEPGTRPLRKPQKIPATPHPRRSGAKGRVRAAHSSTSHIYNRAPRLVARVFGPPTRVKGLAGDAQKRGRRSRLTLEPHKRRQRAAQVPKKEQGINKHIAICTMMMEK